MTSPNPTVTPTSSSSTRAACGSAPRTSSTRALAKFARCPANGPQPRSSLSPAASRSRRAQALLARSPGVIDLIVGTQRVKMLPVLVQQKCNHARCPAIDVTTPYDEPSFPLGLTRRDRPRQGATSPSSRAATISAVSASCRTPGATNGCDPRPRSWAKWRRPRQPGARKCSSLVRSSTTTRRQTILPATSRPCSRRSTRSRASNESVSPARIPGTRAIA